MLKYTTPEPMSIRPAQSAEDWMPRFERRNEYLRHARINGHWKNLLRFGGYANQAIQAILGPDGGRMDSVGEDNGMNGMNLFSNRKESNPWTRLWIGLGLAVSHWSLAAYLPVVGPRVLRFDVKTSVPASSIMLPPLNSDGSMEKALSVATNSPPQHVDGNGLAETNSMIQSTQRAETEADPTPTVVDVTPAELYGPPVANIPTDIGPQTFMRFFQVRGTNGTRLLSSPNLFNPPVAVPVPSSTATYEVR